MTGASVLTFVRFPFFGVVDLERARLGIAICVGVDVGTVVEFVAAMKGEVDWCVTENVDVSVRVKKSLSSLYDEECW
jgi:hypothetical protein